jgi:hypothetical protein
MAARAKSLVVDVVVEVGRKRIFASALAWPGWSRSAKATQGEAVALQALADYASRYQLIAERAGLTAEFTPLLSIPRWRVVERLPGDATTDFGAPSRPAVIEDASLGADAAQQMIDLLAASWWELDDLAATAPARLRKGPRGGGRDRDAVVEHVINAEVSYSRKLGLRNVSTPDPRDREAREGLRARVQGALVESLPRGKTDLSAWSPRYVVRRMAWHVLDHIWEIEDRSDEETS